MSVPSSSECAVHKQIQVTYKDLHKHYGDWLVSEIDVKPHFDNLTNLVEQYNCVCNADLQSQCDIFENFPDVKERLIFKMMTEIEQSLQVIDSLRSTQSKIICQVHKQVQVLNDKCRQVSVNSLCEGEATWPSIAGMVLGIQQTHYIFYTLYQKRKILLENFTANDEESLQKLISSWVMSNDQKNYIQMVLAKEKLHQLEKFDSS